MEPKFVRRISNPLGRFVAFRGAVMSPSDLVNCYRLYAASCVEIARDLEPNRKLIFLDMAQAWIRLANRTEKSPDALFVYETPLAQPPPEKP
jgi:hypothetical protein